MYKPISFLLLLHLTYSCSKPVDQQLLNAINNSSTIEAGVYKDGGSVGIMLVDEKGVNYITIWVPADNKNTYILTNDINSTKGVRKELNSKTKNLLAELIKDKNTSGNSDYVISALLNNKK